MGSVFHGPEPPRVALLESDRLFTAVLTATRLVFCGELLFTNAPAPVGPEPEIVTGTVPMFLPLRSRAPVLVMVMLPAPSAETVLPATTVPAVIKTGPLKALLLPPRVNLPAPALVKVPTSAKLESKSPSTGWL